MEPIGESFFYDIPAEAMACDHPVRVVAWKTSTPGLVINAVPGGELHGLVISHEATGWALFDRPVDFENVEKLRLIAGAIGRLGVDWTAADIAELYDALAKLPSENIVSFATMTTFSQQPSWDVPQLRVALRRTAEFVRSRRERMAQERKSWN